jgi:hypothetical protein
VKPDGQPTAAEAHDDVTRPRSVDGVCPAAQACRGRIWQCPAPLRSGGAEGPRREMWTGGDELCVVLVRAPRGGFRSENGDEQAGAVFENSAEL